MVLIGDIVGDDDAAVARAASEVVRVANARTGEGFIAVSAEARKKFWLDRSKTAAISRHTNAFKLNEDVVIPLPRMGEYTDAIERINIELSIENKLELLAELDRYLASPFPLGKTDDVELDRLSRDEVVGDRVEQARELLAYTHARWSYLLTHLDTPLAEALPELSRLGLTHLTSAHLPNDSDRRGQASPLRVFDLLQDHTIRVSWKTEVRAPLERIFSGAAFAPALAECEAIHQRVLRGRVFVALHMHAGDGNVHTNIPVNSDNYAMLQRAYAAVARIMQIARDLDGVISGEHGIGITKLEFLTDDETAAFRQYKRSVDPGGPFQQGQAAAGRRPAQRVHAELRADGPRVADHAAERHQGHLGRHQGLPALRQVQAGVLDARAGRQPALFAAQQDPRDLAADRGLPVRGTDAPRRVDQALGRVLRRRRPLHRLPQVRGALPGGHRLRRRVDGDARPAAPDGQEEVQSGQRGLDVLPERQGPADDQARAHADAAVGLQGAALRPRLPQARGEGPDEPSAGDHRAGGRRSPSR